MSGHRRLGPLLVLASTLAASMPAVARADPPADDPAATLGTIDLATEHRVRRPVAVPSRDAPELDEADTVARIRPLGDESGAPTPVIGMGAFNAAPLRAAPLPARAPERASLPIPPIEPHSPGVEFYLPADAEKPTQPVPVPLVEEQVLPGLPDAPAPAAPVAVAAREADKEAETATPAADAAPAAASGAGTGLAARLAAHGETRRTSDLELWRASLEGVNRPSQSLAGQAGKLTVVHFWADWCAPCMEELPQLEAFYREAYPELERAGLRLVTISNDMRAADAEKAIRQHDLTFPVFLDGRQKVNRDLARTRALPLTVIVGEDGDVDILSVGKFEWTADAFEALLAERRSSS